MNMLQQLATQTYDAPEAVAEWRLQIEILADAPEESLDQQGRAIQDAPKDRGRPGRVKTISVAFLPGLGYREARTRRAHRRIGSGRPRLPGLRGPEYWLPAVGPGHCCLWGGMRGAATMER